MKRDEVLLLDILAAARLAIEYVRDTLEADFLADTRCQDAVIRRIEIIGEAARRVSEGTKSDLGELPWSEMIGMRNLLVHDYDGIDLRVVWETVQHDLPRLVSLLVPLVPPDEAER